MPSAHALRPQPAPAPVQAAAPRPPPPAPPQTPAIHLPGVAAPAPRMTTQVFGMAPGAAAQAPAPQPTPAVASLPPVAPPAAAPLSLDLASSEEDESFSVEVDEAEPVAPAPPAVAAASAAPSRLPTVPAPVKAPAPAPAPAAKVAASTKASTLAPDLSEVHARPASLWRRLLAFSIDTGAIAGVAALYLLLASSVAGVRTPETGLSGLDAFVVQMRALQSVLVPGAVLVLLLSLVYCAVSAFLWNGRTLGRRLLGLRLVDTHGLAPAPGRAIIRAMLAILSFGLFLAGFWMALFDRRGQTLHDKLTSTYVVQPS